MAIHAPVESPLFGGRQYGTAKERKAQRLAANRANKEYRQARAYRLRFKGAKDDVEAANLFLQLGIDYLNTPKHLLAEMVMKNITGRRADSISTKAMEFLTDNYDARVVKDEEGRALIQFLPAEPEKEEEERPMKLYSLISERTGQTRKVVKEVYEALVLEARKGLRTERLFKLPELGRLKISYRPAKEKRKGRNPFSGKEMWFKAKPASNKLRFSAAKPLKLFIANKVEVVEPKKKHKKKKSKK